MEDARRIKDADEDKALELAPYRNISGRFESDRGPADRWMFSIRNSSNAVSSASLFYGGTACAFAGNDDSLPIRHRTHGVGPEAGVSLLTRRAPRLSLPKPRRHDRGGAKISATAAFIRRSRAPAPSFGRVRRSPPRRGVITSGCLFTTFRKAREVLFTSVDAIDIAFRLEEELLFNRL